MDEIVHPVLRSLGIADTPFSQEEYEVVKKSVQEGKQVGPDEIPPEVWKRCDLDDILRGYVICRELPSFLILQNFNPKTILK